MAVEDVARELNHLVDSGVISTYAIGGAVAAQAYIAPMSTEDIDVFVVLQEPAASSLAPLTSVYTDLIARGAMPDGECLVIGGWPVQLLPPLNPLYDSAIASARSEKIGAEVLRIMDPEHLAAIALQTGRAKDHLRLQEFIRTHAFALPAFLKLVNEFGLGHKWEQFQLQNPDIQ